MYSDTPPNLRFMKKIIKPTLILLCIILFTSCSNEEYFLETITDVPSTDDIDAPSINSQTPCDFSLDNIQPNSTIVINCLMDLKGATVYLPSNVTIVYEGGDIVNGTIKFSENAIIDSQILNSTLNISGAPPQVKDPTFDFDPTRWGIVQGKVTDEIALNNKEIFNSIIKQSKEMGITTFQIGEMNAYFKVDINSISRVKNSNASIQIPSDFHLKMGDNTFLRVQPNAAATYTLMTTYLADNIKISGGNLIGDRFEHDYSPITDEAGVKRDEHGWGHLLWVIGSHNIVVDNLKISKATGDGVVFHAKDRRNFDGTLQSTNKEVKNVLIKNSTITECRRNNISFLDGRDIIIDNCIITNSGNGEQAYDASGSKIYSSAGTAPRYGIDLEAIRERQADNSLNITAIIENVVIKNSTFTGNEAGDIVVYTANDVIIENNYFDKWVANYASYNVDIRSNTFESRDPTFTALVIQSYKDLKGNELNYNYKISNNTIKNYGVGIKVSGFNQEVDNNIITDCKTGIFLTSNLTNGNFHDNTITSSLDVSFGYKNFYNCQNLVNVNFSDESVYVKNRPISLIHILDESNLDNTQITFRNCELNTENPGFKLHVNTGKNIKFEGNQSNTDFQIIASENVVLTNNAVNQ